MKTKPQSPSKAAEKNADDACKLRDQAIKMMKSRTQRRPRCARSSIIPSSCRSRAQISSCCLMRWGAAR